MLQALLSSLWPSLQEIHVFFVLESPELDTALQMQPSSSHGAEVGTCKPEEKQMKVHSRQKPSVLKFYLEIIKTVGQQSEASTAAERHGSQESVLRQLNWVVQYLTSAKLDFPLKSVAGPESYAVVEGNKVSPESPLLQTEQPRFPQLLPIRLVIQIFTALLTFSGYTPGI